MLRLLAFVFLSPMYAIILCTTHYYVTVFTGCKEFFGRDGSVQLSPADYEKGPRYGMAAIAGAFF
jgi:hypothetical protein